jgi:hypothetical protein
VELENLKDLVDLTIPAEHGLFLHQFGKDASDRPDIDSEAVLLLPEENLGRPVPEGLDLVREGLDGQAEGAGESEVGNLEGARLVDEKILGLEVAVDDPARVAVVEAIAELVEEELDLVRGHRRLVLPHVLLQVVVHQLEYEVQLLLGWDVENFAETEW